jgi:diguanylate cyclase (GGDEF)-like protein/PAS domain S-box-containing protein
MLVGGAWAKSGAVLRMAVDFGHLIFALIQSVGELALVAAGYTALRRRVHWPSPGLALALGVLFGLGAVLTMSFRIEVWPGVLLDGRNILTALSVVFGGWLAGVATVLIAIAYRIWLGNAGVEGAILAMAASATAGGLYRLLCAQGRIRLGWVSLLVLGCSVVGITVASFLLLNPAATATAAIALALPLLIVVPLGTLLLGLALQSEDQRAALQETVRRSEQRFKEAIDAMADGYALFDADDRLVAYNHWLLNEEQKGVLGEPIGHTSKEIIDAFAHNELTAVNALSDRAAWMRWRMEIHTNPPTLPVEIQWTDGRWVRVTERRTAEGGYVGVWVDITALKQRERELTASQAKTELALDLLRAITDSVPAQVAHVDAEERYAYCNRAYEEVLGIAAEALVGLRISEAIPPALYTLAKPHIQAALAGEEAVFVSPLPTTAGEETRHAERHYIPDRDAEGKVVGFYTIAWDITDRYRREQALDKEASTDALTGLLNRRAMMQALETAGAAWASGGPHGAVLYLDIDKFKQVNDTRGHDSGDALLKVFADRIRMVVRASDKVARLGGDEFVILLTAQDADDVARRIATGLLDNVRQPINLGTELMSISTSIGVAVFTGPEPSPERLLKEADLALYEAKREGRDRYVLRRVATEPVSM